MNFGISPKLEALGEKALENASKRFAEIESTTEQNQRRVLSAFIKNKVSESHFTESTGYGYGDRGRENLDRVLADSFSAQDALIRHSFASGTHTLGVALFGLLRPGDVMLSVMGKPYDTIQPVIGITGGGMGSLKDFGVEYRQVELDRNGRADLEAIENALTPDVKLVYIQRSRGYSLRPSLLVEDIEKICRTVKKKSGALIMVDNCYGEFVEKSEPIEAGADLIAGSLIKNPGGGIAKCGGYIAGSAELVGLCAYRMTVPGVGREVGATLGQNRELYMGLFNAPHVVGEALKTAVFASALFELLGFESSPSSTQKRGDIIQSIMLGNESRLTAFCRGVQSGSPVDSFVVPEAWDMPGYDSKVIMSAGAFTGGSSIELSADAPLREPYAVWLQGGLNFHSAKLGILLAAQKILDEEPDLL